MTSRFIHITALVIAVSIISPHQPVLGSNLSSKDMDHPGRTPSPGKTSGQSIKKNQQAENAVRAPWQLVRHLQRVQDSIVAGRPGSLNAYRKLLVKYSGMMLVQPNSVWSNKKNLNAASIYVLIGGSPAVGANAYQKSPLDEVSKKPLKAAIAYSKRNFAEAHKLMMGIDHTALPASAAAQFALAKSMVTSATNIKLASELLDDARRLAPGTLIDEASLRRSLRITGNSKDLQKFRRNASSYFRHFGNSLYFGAFFKNFAYGLVRMPQENQAEVLTYLQEFLKKLDENQQLKILVYTARNATILGRVGIANWASNQALERLGKNRNLRTQMELYLVASGIVQPDLYEASLVQFKKIDRSILNESDKKLFDAVASLARRLQSDALDMAGLKLILQEKQQTYPGEEPSIPAKFKMEAEIIESNETVRRSQRLFSDLEKLVQKETK